VRGYAVGLPTLGLAAVAAAAAVAGGPIPTPIGKGPRFHPPPAHAAVREGRPVAGLTCGAATNRVGVHVELYARGLVVIVPAGIGVARPFARRGAYVLPGGCSYAIRTREPTGLLEVEPGRGLRLGDLFRVWGQPLSATRLAGFRTTRGRPVRAYVSGRRWRGDAQAIRLRRHGEIVLELGAYIPPHRAYAFPPGL
jgi:hypothetical protein